MNFTRTVDTDLSYDDAVAAVKTALAEQGFGTLTEIDVRQTIKDKLDIDTDPQLIIGACNPHLAHQALRVDPASRPCCPATSSSDEPQTAPSSKRSTRRSWPRCRTAPNSCRSPKTLPAVSRPPSMRSPPTDEFHRHPPACVEEPPVRRRTGRAADLHKLRTRRLSRTARPQRGPIDSTSDTTSQSNTALTAVSELAYRTPWTKRANPNPRNERLPRRADSFQATRHILWELDQQGPS